MWDLSTNALDTAQLRGASYSDTRVMHLRQRDLTTKNGQVGTLAQSESIGIGIRVLANGAWGFASTDKLTRAGVAACAAQAVSIAKASALAKRGDVVLADDRRRRLIGQECNLERPVGGPASRVAAAGQSRQEQGQQDPTLECQSSLHWMISSG